MPTPWGTEPPVDDPKPPPDPKPADPPPSNP